MPEPSFIAPLVPRTAADERWHLRAELRDAAVHAFWHAVPVLIGLLVLLPYGAAWLGVVIPIGLYFGGRRAQAVVERPHTGAAPGPLRMPATPSLPSAYETRLCTMLAAQDSQRHLWGPLVAGGLLAVGDLLRIPLAVSAIPAPTMLLNNPFVVGLILGGGAAFCGYWLVLGSRYLAARAMVATDETLSGVIGRR